MHAARAAAVREAAEEASLDLDPSGLVPFSFWVPPLGGAKRFATWFFLIEVRNDGSAVVVDRAGDPPVRVDDAGDGDRPGQRCPNGHGASHVRDPVVAEGPDRHARGYGRRSLTRTGAVFHPHSYPRGCHDRSVARRRRLRRRRHGSGRSSSTVDHGSGFMADRNASLTKRRQPSSWVPLSWVSPVRGSPSESEGPHVHRQCTTAWNSSSAKSSPRSASSTNVKLAGPTATAARPTAPASSAVQTLDRGARRATEDGIQH